MDEPRQEAKLESHVRAESVRDSGLCHHVLALVPDPAADSGPDGQPAVVDPSRELRNRLQDQVDYRPSENVMRLDEDLGSGIINQPSSPTSAKV